MPTNFMGSNVGFGAPGADQQMEIQRRMKMAEALQAQGMAPIQQSAPIHPFQGLAKLAQTYVGKQQGSKAESLAKALGQQQTDRRGADMSLLVKALQGRQAQPAGLSEDAAGNVTPTDPMSAQTPSQSLQQAIPMMQDQGMQQAALPLLMKQFDEPTRVDLGDRIGLVRNGALVGFLPKGATPDATLREGGAQTRHVTPSGSAALGAETTRRGQDISATTTTRGQDITAQTASQGQAITVRGQDLSSETQRRGQDLTDTRERDVGLAARLAAARESGKSQAESAAQLPGAIAKAEQGLSVLNQMLGSKGRALRQGEAEVAPHPGFEDYVGATWRPGMRYLEGSNASGFEALFKQITGQAFLQAFESLKGGGQITQIEGEKGTQAITRMNKAQNEAEFVTAAREFEEVIRTGIERAKQKAGAPSAQQGWSIEPL